jgi:hypothetical protein
VTTQHAAIEGIGLWTPRMPGWGAARAVLRGEAQPAPVPAQRPAPALLPANERRRAPDTVAVSLEAASAACADAGRDPATLPSVFASTFGDQPITDYMCATLADDASLLSPTRFHNSVHNAAAGYWSIATGCLAPYTALSAGEFTFAAGLLEALVQCACDGAAVLFVAYDVASRGPLEQVTPSGGMLSAALVLGPAGSTTRRAKLGWRVLDGTDPAPADAHHAILADGNAMSGCLALFEALAAGAPGGARLPLGPCSVLELQVEMERR